MNEKHRLTDWNTTKFGEECSALSPGFAQKTGLADEGIVWRGVRGAAQRFRGALFGIEIIYGRFDHDIAVLLYLLDEAGQEPVWGSAGRIVVPVEQALCYMGLTSILPPLRPLKVPIRSRAALLAETHEEKTERQAAIAAEIRAAVGLAFEYASILFDHQDRFVLVRQRGRSWAKALLKGYRRFRGERGT